MRTTLPGTVQLRVIADEGDTERLAEVLHKALEEAEFSVITTTVDAEDRFDSTRRKFHIIAVPTNVIAEERSMQGERLVADLVAILKQESHKPPVSAEHGHA